MPYLKKDTDISTPIKAIQIFCIECCGGNRNYVKECCSPKCALYDYRLGKNPNRKAREYTEEEKQELRDRVRKARESRNH